MREKSPASLAFLRLSVKMPLCFLGPWESLSKCHPFTRILEFPSWGFHPRWLSSEQQYRNPSPSLAVDFSPWWEGEANGTLGEPLRGVPWMMGQDTPGEEGLPQLSTCSRTPKQTSFALGISCGPSLTKQMPGNRNPDKGIKVTNDLC